MPSTGTFGRPFFAAFWCHWLLLESVASWPADEAPFQLPYFKFSRPDASLESHRQLGEAMGREFATGTRARLEGWSQLQGVWLPALRTEDGQRLYQGFLEVHRAVYPMYLAELEGIAAGAGLPFEWVFVAQLAQEFAGQLNGTHLKPAAEDHCSDYMICSEVLCVDGHNEDNDVQNVNRTFVADVQLGGGRVGGGGGGGGGSGSRFLALVYMGELPSGGFGVNGKGIGFSLNWVGPPPSREPGLGRGFVSRSLLDAQGPEDALSRMVRKGQAGGHNAQIFDFCGRSISNVEVAQDRFAVRAIEREAFFHANQYESLQVPGETYSNSSVHRLRRVRELRVPSSLHEILQVLGDQGDKEYPIFHDTLSHARGELSDWTVASAVFDLDNRTVSIMEGNPKGQRVRQTWNVTELMGGHCQPSPSPGIAEALLV